MVIVSLEQELGEFFGLAFVVSLEVIGAQVGVGDFVVIVRDGEAALAGLWRRNSLRKGGRVV